MEPNEIPNTSAQSNMSKTKLLMYLSIPIILLGLLIGTAYYLNQRNKRQNTQSDEVDNSQDSSLTSENSANNNQNSTPTLTPKVTLKPTQTITGTLKPTIILTPTPTQKPIQTPSTSSVVAPKTSTFGTGTIKGQLLNNTTYKTIQVCAESTTKSFIKCTSIFKDNGYNLSMPIDSYVVFAVLNNNSRAYYTDYVQECLIYVCGNKYDGKQHNALNVNVSDNITIIDINPWDIS